MAAIVFNFVSKSVGTVNESHELGAKMAAHDFPNQIENKTKSKAKHHAGRIFQSYTEQLDESRTTVRAKCFHRSE